MMSYKKSGFFENIILRRKVKT